MRVENYQRNLPAMFYFEYCVDFSVLVTDYLIGFPFDWPLPIVVSILRFGNLIHRLRHFFRVHYAEPMIPIKNE